MAQINTKEPVVVAVAVARAVDVSLDARPAAAVVWDANARERAVNSADPAVRAGARKPVAWSEVLTTQSGEFVVQAVMPDRSVVELTRLVLTVEAGRVGVLSVRTAAGQRAEPEPVEGE